MIEMDRILASIIFALWWHAYRYVRLHGTRDFADGIQVIDSKIRILTRLSGWFSQKQRNFSAWSIRKAWQGGRVKRRRQKDLKHRENHDTRCCLWRCTKGPKDSECGWPSEDEKWILSPTWMKLKMDYFQNLQKEIQSCQHLDFCLEYTMQRNWLSHTALQLKTYWMLR